MARTQRLQRGSSRTEENAWRCTPPTTLDCDVSYRCGGGAGSGDDDVRCDDSGGGDDGGGGSGGVHLVARRVTGGGGIAAPARDSPAAVGGAARKTQTPDRWVGWVVELWSGGRARGGGMSSETEINEITFCSPGDDDDDDDRYFKCYLKYYNIIVKRRAISCRIFRRLKVAGSLGLDG